ncbi:hypothetical protein AN1V17_47290 [Vallitalea sediminicola]
MINIVNATLSNRQIKKATKKLATVKDGTPKAINAAINATIKPTKDTSKKLIKDNYEIKASKPITKTMLTRKSTVHTLTARLDSKGSPLPLIKFSVSPKKVPKRKPKILKAAVLKGGAKKGIPNTFTAKMANGHIGVFERTSDGRLPIQEKYGPSVPSMMKSDDVKENIEVVANKVLKKNLKLQIKKLTKG